MKLGILKSFIEIDDLVDSYAKACEELGIDYVIIDLLSNTWIEDIKKSGIDGVLVREKANIDEYKWMYNERLWVIKEYLHIPIYPSWHELFLYEDKRLYAYYFQTHNIPTPPTHIFYRKSDAIQYLKSATYPLICKTSGGSTGSGVQKIKSYATGKLLAHRIFGLFNPRLAIGDVRWANIKKCLWAPKIGMAQRHYMIIQDYIDVSLEWRIIKIGNTYAGYKRPIVNGRASCKLMEYGFPPKELLVLIKQIADNEKFDSLSLDVLVDKQGKYYVTEMQSLFGSFNLIQCAVDGVPGRIVESNGDFIFEEGKDFFKLNSNLLRVKDFVEKIRTKYYDN